MSLNAEHMTARLAIVKQHIQCENRHDLNELMRTFGQNPHYDDVPWGDYREGIEGVRSYYNEMISALPDLSIEVEHQHVASDAVVVEVIIRGSHQGAWRGLPATGRSIKFQLCGIYTFDDADRISGERIYYDRSAVLGQLGLFHEPVRGLGRVMTALSHPITISRAYLRRPH
jgi:steroid delta-isomerase-like uncharacterized protein